MASLMADNCRCKCVVPDPATSLAKAPIRQNVAAHECSIDGLEVEALWADKVGVIANEEGHILLANSPLSMEPLLHWGCREGTSPEEGDGN